MNDVKIALISATPLAIAPAAAAVSAAIPNSTVWNLLDDRLLADLKQQGEMTEPLAARMDILIESALAGGADGVLLTCSQYGVRADHRDPAIDGVGVFSADGPLFEKTVSLAPANVLLVASLDSAAADSTVRLRAVFAAAGTTTNIHSVVVPAASEPLATPELAAHLAAAIAEVSEAYDVVVLAQYSLAPAAEALRENTTVPVLDGPSVAAARLRDVIDGSPR
ncbi:hypothetical protein C5B85_07730 [Pseudoclavibacter sp. AY1F1]|uniref:hypothetical protein n=1 Tax=Pseudoclavibacter sp. AY1F1 TaxID=2080583 RepID=UPI000CE91CF5|nr:hypothetical protein [Pseudoclavibacter sp. AY1F1]PPF45449.1 hypothetical protein C5B85_07730 [Pseudoclavibacter sp. AY1F1]